MTVQDKIKAALIEIMSDRRLSYESATIFENAPLALIQLGLETKRDTLKWVLKLFEDEQNEADTTNT